MLSASALPITGIACCNPQMLMGESLGAALREAMKQKGVTQHDVAAAFGVRQPSVSEWLRYGRVAKKHIPALVNYFSDVVGPEHWGLPNNWHSRAPEAQLSPRVLEVAMALEKRRVDSPGQFRWAMAICEAIAFTDHPPETPAEKAALIAKILEGPPATPTPVQG